MWGKNGIFGSTERRFVQLSNLQTPAPGQYTAKGSIGQLSQVVTINDSKRVKPIFGSKTKRLASANPTTKPETFGVLQYDVASNTIGASVIKKVDSVSNPLLANLAKRN